MNTDLQNSVGLQKNERICPESQPQDLSRVSHHLNIYTYLPCPQHQIYLLSRFLLTPLPYEVHMRCACLCMIPCLLFYIHMIASHVTMVGCMCQHIILLILHRRAQTCQNSANLFLQTHLILISVSYPLAEAVTGMSHRCSTAEGGEIHELANQDHMADLQMTVSDLQVPDLHDWPSQKWSENLMMICSQLQLRKRQG